MNASSASTEYAREIGRASEDNLFESAQLPSTQGVDLELRAAGANLEQTLPE